MCGPETLIAVERHSGAYPFLLEIAPLRDSQSELDTQLSGAIVFIVDPDNPRPFSAGNLGRCFHLTKAEMMVCQFMLGGLSDADIASARGVSLETVKSQAKAIYRKTRTSKRSELIRLALSITPPIDVPAAIPPTPPLDPNSHY